MTAPLARLEAAMVPARIRAAAIDARSTPAVKAVEAFLDAGDSFLVLSGPPGCGKSTAAAVAIANLPPEVTGAYRDLSTGELHQLTRPRSGLWVDAHALAVASNFAEDFWHALLSTHLLVIDDLGREQLDGAGRALGNLLALLCRRHDDLRSTLITTNLPPKAWTARYCVDGGRLLDRLTEQEHRHNRPAFHQVVTPSMRTAAGGVPPATPSEPAASATKTP